MIRLAGEAVICARDVHRIELDYSVQSLEALSRVVTKLHDDRPGWVWRTLGFGPRPDELKFVASMFGAYAGEVFRQAKGGEWQLEETTGACGVLLDNAWIFPIQRVHVQLLTGRASDYIEPLSPHQLSH